MVTPFGANASIGGFNFVNYPFLNNFLSTAVEIKIDQSSWKDAVMGRFFLFLL